MNKSRRTVLVVALAAAGLAGCAGLATAGEASGTQAHSFGEVTRVVTPIPLPRPVCVLHPSIVVLLGSDPGRRFRPPECGPGAVPPTAPTAPGPDDGASAPVTSASADTSPTPGAISTTDPDQVTPTPTDTEVPTAEEPAAGATEPIPTGPTDTAAPTDDDPPTP